MNLKLANITEDVHILEQAREIAFDIIDKDPELTQPENQPLRRQIDLILHNNPWSKIS